VMFPNSSAIRPWYGAADLARVRRRSETVCESVDRWSLKNLLAN
jgi:hypothetical protein